MEMRTTHSGRFEEKRKRREERKKERNRERERERERFAALLSFAG